MGAPEEATGISSYLSVFLQICQMDELARGGVVSFPAFLWQIHVRVVGLGEHSQLLCVPEAVLCECCVLGEYKKNKGAPVHKMFGDFAQIL